MRFVYCEGLILDESWKNEYNDSSVRRKTARDIEIRSIAFNSKLGNRAYFFVSDISDGTVSMGCVYGDRGDVCVDFDDYLGVLIDVQADTEIAEEITFSNFKLMLERAEHFNYIRSADEVLEQFELDILDRFPGRCMDFGENLIDEMYAREDIYSEAGFSVACESLVPELDRIYAGRSKGGAKGHPVHYMLYTDEADARRNIPRMLLRALYENNRICSRRYVYVDIRPGERFSLPFYRSLYKSCGGGTVIVRYTAGYDSDEEHATGERDTIEKLCEMMKKYRHKVLTVFCLPHECTKTVSVFRENLVNVSFVEIREDCVSGGKAEKYLEKLAKKNGVRTDKKLFAGLEDSEGYLSSELHQIFDEWYNKKLKTSIYPQYRNVAAEGVKMADEKPRGSAYDELMEMAGLDEAKKVIRKVLDYYKAQKLFADRGMKTDRPSMHMVFTGNPGTAKTSAARLYARIMRENGILSKGHIVEVGRADIVGKYVGWTASIIQKKFIEAKGSVLFIDEAYSLVDGTNGSFGDEAINTIVQEMENHRDDVVVIFAGYPDKMEEFLQKNPGLRSRIAWHIHFADYNTDELCRIADIIADRKGFVLSGDAHEKLNRIFDIVQTESDFGNGRFVRNILEKAKMTQASRLLSMDTETLDKNDIVTVIADDIEVPSVSVKSARQIGFCV